MLGCSKLIIREDDNAALISAKAATRTVLGLSTVGMSEGFISDAKRKEAQQHKWEQFVRDMDSSIGRMTYDEALSIWGPPTKVERGQDILVASWGSVRQGPPLLVNGMILGGRSHGYEFTLWFHGEKALLTKWDVGQW
jgi:hypothetical protein